MSWTETLSQKLSSYAAAEFDYKETRDVNEASSIDLGVSGLYMEATIIYLEIKNVPYILKEHGRRAMAKAYTMVSTVLNAVAQDTGAFVNNYSPNAFLIVYPNKDNNIEEGFTLTKEEKRILKNVPFAYRGHVFKDQGLKKFFESTNWYVPDPEYKDDMGTMTQEEREWIEFWAK